MKFIGRTGDTFEVKAIDSSNMRDIQDSENNDLTVIWFLEDGSEMEIDGILYYFKNLTYVFHILLLMNYQLYYF